jgi:hypothetical protein
MAMMARGAVGQLVATEERSRREPGGEVAEAGVEDTEVDVTSAVATMVAGVTSADEEVALEAGVATMGTAVEATAGVAIAGRTGATTLAADAAAAVAGTELKLTV